MMWENMRKNVGINGWKNMWKELGKKSVSITGKECKKMWEDMV